MTHSHPSYPYVRRLLMAATMMSFAIGPTACKPKVGSQIKAIFSGGKGFALIPARRFTATGGNGPEFENSIRMMMLPVKCSSESEVVTLENFALSSQDGVRYAGRSVLDTNGVPIPGTKSCAVLGNYALHFWAAQYLFPGNPKNDQEYHRQQWVYLALRGPYNKQNQGAKPPAVEKFFAEAGSVRLSNSDLSMLALWDSFFNPCLPLDTAKASGFDKKRHFKCEGTNYRSVSGNPDDATLTTLIANASDSLIYRMANGEFAPVNTAGLETAIRLYAPTGNALGLTGNTGKSAGKTTAKRVFNGQWQRGQHVRNLRRFVFAPARGRQTSSYDPTSAGNCNVAPTRVQFEPPVPTTVPATVLSTRGNRPPVPGSQPPFVPGVDSEQAAGNGNLRPTVPNQTESVRVSPSMAQRVKEWERTGEAYDEKFFDSRPQDFQDLEAYAKANNIPVSDIIGEDSPLWPQYFEKKLSQQATNPEPSAPLLGIRGQSVDDVKNSLTSNGYKPSAAFKGWYSTPEKQVNRDTSPLTGYQTETLYSHPDGRPNEKLVTTYNTENKKISTAWQRQGANNQWDLLTVKNSNGDRIGGGHEYNDETNQWEPLSASDTAYSGGGGYFGSTDGDPNTSNRDLQGWGDEGDEGDEDPK